jgi:hypothetical protein
MHPRIMLAMSFPTLHDFLPHVGETFRAVVDDEWEIHLRLSQAAPWPGVAATEGARVPYTLLFHAPAEANVGQRVVRLEHEGLAPVDLFIVPLGPDSSGMRYEAVIAAG